MKKNLFKKRSEPTKARSNESRTLLMLFLRFGFLNFLVKKIKIIQKKFGSIFESAKIKSEPSEATPKQNF